MDPKTRTKLISIARKRRSMKIAKVIREVDGKFCVFSKAGERLGCHDTRAAANAQLAAIEVNKGHLHVHLDAAGDLTTGLIPSDAGANLHVHLTRDATMVGPAENTPGHVHAEDNVGATGPAIDVQIASGHTDEDEEASHGPTTKRFIPIVKAEEQGDERFILGIVYEPDTVDAHGDFAKADTIRSAAHQFLAEFGTVNLMHMVPLEKRQVSIVESGIAHADFRIGNEVVKKGSWIMAAIVHDDDLWADIKSGAITGWSLEGFADFDETSKRDTPDGGDTESLPDNVIELKVPEECWERARKMLRVDGNVPQLRLTFGDTG